MTPHKRVRLFGALSCARVCAQLSMPEAEYVAAVPALSTALSAPHIRSVYEVGAQGNHSSIGAVERPP